jgi:Virulence-associated protein E
MTSIAKSPAISTPQGSTKPSISKVNGSHGVPAMSNNNTYVDTVNFLDALGDKHTFQTFGEGESKSAKPQILHGTWAEHEKTLTALNETQGIFVTVSQTDGLGRTKTNILAPRALFLDFDGTEPDPAKLAKLPEPSAIVQSKSGKHLYWFLVPGEPLEDLEPALTKLIGYLGSDPACKDMGRVMRIPGSWHHKAEPFQTQLVSFEPDNRYAIADVIGNIAPMVPVAPTVSEVAPVLPTVALDASGVNPQNFHSRLSKVKAADRLSWMLAALRDSENGSRNVLLNLVAYEAFALTGLGFPQATLEAMLTQAAMDAGLEPTEVAATIKSAFSGAEAKGKNLTPTQKIWANFDRVYGDSLRYNQRSLNLESSDGVSDTDVLRIGYINSTGQDLSGDRYTQEIMGWVKANHAYDPDVFYLNSLLKPSTAEARGRFEELAEAMGLDDLHSLRLIQRHRIGRVARSLEPGCSMQWALGLVGDPGCGKTSYLQSYSPDSQGYQQVGAGIASDKSMDKDVWLSLLNGVVADISEIDTIMSGVAFGRLKSVLERSHVTVRPPYGRSAITAPLRFVWAFTSNRESPLHDDGANNRRYAIVRLSGTRAQGNQRVAYYKANADRLNAAALALYKAGEPWNLTDTEAEIEAGRIADGVDRSLPYALALHYLPQVEAQRFTGETEAQGFHLEQLEALCTPPDRKGRLFPAEKQDIKAALSQLGWVSVQRRFPAGKARLWMPSSFDPKYCTGMIAPRDFEELQGRVTSAL